MRRRQQQVRWGGVRTAAAFALGLIAAGGLIASPGCAEDLRDRPYTPEEIWGPLRGEPAEVSEPVDFRPRSADCDLEPSGCYGLPRPGQPGIADLIALLPTRAPQNSAPDLYVAPGIEVTTDQCRAGGPGVLSGLPMTIEGVVTLYPRRYLKPTICGQDERNYGVFTLEDDTGGIVVLRDSRVTPYTLGDRVRVTVHGVVFTSRFEVDTRSILIADIEPLPAPESIDPETGLRQLARPILYAEKLSERFKVFSFLDVAQVKRVDGYVHVAPSLSNFGRMVMTERRVSASAAELLTYNRQCADECLRRCLPACGTDTNLNFAAESAVKTCGDICAEECVDGQFAITDLPGCWIIGVDVELTRRNNTYTNGERLRVTGPVVNSFDYQIWVLTLGQVERLP
jgi:hypothetical protein